MCGRVFRILGSRIYIVAHINCNERSMPCATETTRRDLSYLIELMATELMQPHGVRLVIATRTWPIKAPRICDQHSRAVYRSTLAPTRADVRETSVIGPWAFRQGKPSQERLLMCGSVGIMAWKQPIGACKLKGATAVAGI